jgi:hypothetical protein
LVIGTYCKMCLCLWSIVVEPIEAYTGTKSLEFMYWLYQQVMPSWQWHWNYFSSYFYPSVTSEIKDSRHFMAMGHSTLPPPPPPPPPPPMDEFFLKGDYKFVTKGVKPVGILWSLQFFWGEFCTKMHKFGKMYNFLRGGLCRHFVLFYRRVKILLTASIGGRRY